MEYGITDQGFVLKRFDVILAEMQAEISSELGFDVSVDPQSALNAAIIYPMADRFATLWELAQASYYAKFPSTATGVNLDNACQFGSVTRENNQPTQYMIHCTGTDGTEIPEGSLIESATSPKKQLQCASVSTITRDSFNIIKITPAIVAEDTYTVTLNGVEYNYWSSDSDTAEDIARHLAYVIKADGYTTTADGNVVTITDETISRNNKVELTNNLTTASVTSIIQYNTVEYGNIYLPNGTVNVIVTNVTGLESVVNRITPIAGRLQETDTELRQSYIKKSFLTSVKTTDSIASYLYDTIKGVNSLTVFENDTDLTDSDGRPPHSIEVVIYGGDDQSIAEAILEKKAGGIATYGTTTLPISTQYGDVINVSFSRPENVYIWMKLRITMGVAPANYETLIRNAIMDAVKDFEVGTDVMYQKLYSSIYGAVSSITKCVITLGTSASGSSTPSEYVEDNIAITDRQIALFDPSRIEVILV